MINIYIPYNNEIECPYRYQAFEEVYNHYKTFNDVNIKIVTSYPFTRSASRNFVLQEDLDEEDIIFFIDADIIINENQFINAINKARELDEMVIAYNDLNYLDSNNTISYINGNGYINNKVLYNQCSGAFAIPFGLFKEVGGYDENFISWGCEDRLFYYTACYLRDKKDVLRIEEDAIHLYHPRNSSTGKAVLKNNNLFLEYMDAFGVSIDKWSRYKEVNKDKLKNLFQDFSNDKGYDKHIIDFEKKKIYTFQNSKKKVVVTLCPSDKYDRLINSNDYKLLDNINIKNNRTWNKISIIIPFMYNKERFKLLNCCVENLNNLIKDYDDMEIVIHETGKKRFITEEWIENNNIKYDYNYLDGVFNRAWNLNYAAKHIATGDMFVFMDGDLIVDNKWLKLLRNNNNCCIGWKDILYLNKDNTDKYLKNKVIVNHENRMGKADVYSTAGAINIYPKDLFYTIKGWCEDYIGTWGGEDNSTLLKLLSLGISLDMLNTKIIHLNHDHKTYRDPKRIDIYKRHKKYSKEDWEVIINDDNKKWGDKVCL